MSSSTMSNSQVVANSSDKDLEIAQLKNFLDIFPYTNVYVFENKFTEEQIEKYEHLIKREDIFELGAVYKLNLRGQVYKIYQDKGADYAILFLISQRSVDFSEINVMINNMYPREEYTIDNYKEFKPTMTHIEIIKQLYEFEMRGWIEKENEVYKITIAGKYIVDSGSSIN